MCMLHRSRCLHAAVFFKMHLWLSDWITVACLRLYVLTNATPEASFVYFQTMFFYVGRLREESQMLIHRGRITTTARWCVLIRGQLLGMCLVVFDCGILSLWAQDMIHICPTPDMSDHVVMMTKQSSLSASSHLIARKFCYLKVDLGAEDCHLPPWSLDLSVASFFLSNLEYE